MGFEDGDFGVPDWMQGYGNPGDPLAGSDWTDVTGQAPLDSTQISGMGGLPTTPSTSGFSIQQLLAQLAKGTQPSAGQSTGKAGNLGDLGSLMGAFSQGEKANRVVQGNLTQNYDRTMLAAEQGRNQTESDALKKLAQTSYITGGGSQFKPPTLSLNGKTYNTPDLGFGPPPVSGAEKAGAGALQGQLQARLSPGGTYTPQPLDDYAKPGLAENIGSYGGLATSGLGAILNMMGKGGSSGSPQGSPDGSSGVGNALGQVASGVGTAGSIAKLLGSKGAGEAANGIGSTIGGVLGKAIPIAGAATGLYGMLQNKGLGSNMLSGAGTGASIGSMIVPGLGTAIGGGLGALAGGLESLFSGGKPDANELAGRGAQTSITNQLASMATPQQQADAAKAGWPDPKQALSLIVMRDNFTKQGMDPAQAEAKAEAAMHSMWDNEKGGANAVAQAFGPTQSSLGQGLPAQNGVSSLYGPGGLITDAFSKGARG